MFDSASEAATAAVAEDASVARESVLQREPADLPSEPRMLSGTVDTPELKSRAVQIAQSVQGVKSVNDNLSVKTG